MADMGWSDTIQLVVAFLEVFSGLVTRMKDLFLIGDYYSSF